MSPSSKSIPSLADLHALAQRGDREARAELLHRLYHPIREFLRRRFSNFKVGPDMVDDLTQEAMLRIHTGLFRCQFPDDKRLLAWCLRVSRNAAIDELRRNARHHVQTLLLAELRSTPTPLEAYERPSTASSEFRSIVNQVLAQLEDESHVLLWTRFVENAAWWEVGEALGISAGAAKARWQRIQKKLRNRLLNELRQLPPDRLPPGLKIV